MRRMEQKRIDDAVQKALAWADTLTVDSPVNVPELVVADTQRFFTWDNEHRTPARDPYLFDWSYYTGVVMEGLFDLAEADAPEAERYTSYVRRYVDALLAAGPDGHWHIDRELGGYVDHHGADCYKTAALLVRLTGEDPRTADVCRELYRDLTDTCYVNSAGHNVATEYTDEALGGNYWHTWAKLKPPRYAVWLDGIYMLQPFIAHYAALIGDEHQLALVDRRLSWVSRELRAPNGLYYHAGNSSADACPWFWTRSMGWYGMAMADLIDVTPARYVPARKEALRQFVDGLLPYQRPDGLWTNITDRPASETNRPETSGTAMLAYTMLKGVRLGWLEAGYTEPAVRAFVGLAETKLQDGGLTDIYLKASANGSNNYEKPEYYLTDEGKGAGPFLMALSELTRGVKGA